MNVPASTPDLSTPSSVRAAPVPERDRVHAMDVIRGVALLGILTVNMEFFGNCFSSMFADETAHSLTGVDRVAWWCVQTLFAGKFISLFSFLFGAGIALQAMRSDLLRSAMSTSIMLLRRLGFLAFVGFLHATLVWYGDILFAYATMGWILIPARFLSTRVIAVAGCALLVLAMGCVTGMSMMSVAANDALPQVDADTTVAEETEIATVPDAPTSTELFRSMGKATFWNVLDPQWESFERATYRNGPAEVAVPFRALQWASTLPIIYLLFGPHLLGMFLVGTAVARAGLLNQAHAALHRRVAQICIPAGILCSAVVPTLLLKGASHTDALVAGLASVNELGTTLLALGYAGAIARLAYAGPPALAAFLGRAGRMAFTLYLSMSVLMTGLFYWWGVGLFGTMGSAALVGIGFVTWLGLASVAQVWMRFFTMGPLEWIWRSVTYLELPPLCRRALGAMDA